MGGHLCCTALALTLIREEGVDVGTVFTGARDPSRRPLQLHVLVLVKLGDGNTDSC